MGGKPALKAKTSFSLKDQLFNPEKVGYLASLISAAYPAFDSKKFCKSIISEFPKLELKERIEHITFCLHRDLPKDFSKAVAILVKALPPPLDPTKTDNDFGEFILAPFSHYVASFGCNAKDLDLSLASLREMTKRFSAEDSIRYFINSFPKESLAFLKSCASDDNYHVRRLASEGSRPKLPWCQKLQIPATQALPLLERLYTDETRYVTRSVANHMNDLSKIDPELTISTLKRWKSYDTQNAKEMDYILSHSLRTLVKNGNKQALTVLGFGKPAEVESLVFATTTPKVLIGTNLEFNLSFVSRKKQNLAIDYTMFFFSDKGTPKKTFKLRAATLDAGQKVSISKKHPMRLMTTRALSKGKHKVVLQINGDVLAEFSFELV